MKGNYRSEQAAKTALLKHIDRDGAFVVVFDDGSYDFFLHGEPVSNYNGRDYKVYQPHEYLLVATWLRAWVEPEGVSQ